MSTHSSMLINGTLALPAGECTRVEWQSRLVFVDETREQVQQTREFDRETLQRAV
jgi:hypothetical protein